MVGRKERVGGGDKLIKMFTMQVEKCVLVIEMHRCRDALVLLVAGEKKTKRHTKLSNVFNTHIHTLSVSFSLPLPLILGL